MIGQSSQNILTVAISKTLSYFTGLAALINQQSIFIYIYLVKEEQTNVSLCGFVYPQPPRFRSKFRTRKENQNAFFL